MKKIILLLFILTAFLRAEINECITDIYFGNGVWNDYSGASQGRDRLEGVILRDIYHRNILDFKKHHYNDRGDDEFNRNILLLSFNWTGSSPNTLYDDSNNLTPKVIDLIETFYQLKDNNQLEGYSLYDILKVWLTQDPTSPLSNTLWDEIDDIVGDYSRAIEGTNLVEMIEDYEKISLKESHKVLLVAHSQGNLFGNEVYDNLISWEKDYFQMVSVGTPASSVLGKSTPYTTLKCDKVIHNNIIGGIPGHLSAETNCTGEERSGDGHQFTASYLSNHLSLEEIVTNISERISFLENTSSQWITDQEFDKDTCDYKITVKHQHDPSIEMAEKVYPFNASKKLYQAKNEHGVYEYVKASCGGENILPEWNGKKDNECLMIDNPQEEKIGGGCRIESLFDDNDEGWMIIGDAQQGGSKPNYMDGYIQAVDDVIGGTWYYSAPSKFSGDLSSCYGGSFTFDLMQSRTDRPFVSQDIIIHSNYGTVSHTFGYAPGTSWTSFKKEMVETDWDRSLTEEEFKEILSSVISIDIRGEYRVGYDVGSLDNVIMSQKE